MAFIFSLTSLAFCKSVHCSECLCKQKDKHIFNNNKGLLSRCAHVLCKDLFTSLISLIKEGGGTRKRFSEVMPCKYETIAKREQSQPFHKVHYTSLMSLNSRMVQCHRFRRFILLERIRETKR